MAEAAGVEAPAPKEMAGFAVAEEASAAGVAPPKLNPPAPPLLVALLAAGVAPAPAPKEKDEATGVEAAGWAAAGVDAPAPAPKEKEEAGVEAPAAGVVATAAGVEAAPPKLKPELPPAAPAAGAAAAPPKLKPELPPAAPALPPEGVAPKEKVIVRSECAPAPSLLLCCCHNRKDCRVRVG